MARWKLMLGVGCLLLALGAAHLAKVIEAHSRDWYWTNQNMRLSLAEGRGNVAIFVKDTPLEEMLAKSRLCIADAGTGRTLSAGDLSLRVNKLYELTRADAIWAASLSSSGFAVLVCAFVVFHMERNRSS